MHESATDSRLESELASLRTGQLDAQLLAAASPAVQERIASTSAAAGLKPDSTSSGEKKRPRTPTTRRSGRTASAQNDEEGDVEMRDGEGEDEVQETPAPEADEAAASEAPEEEPESEATPAPSTSKRDRKSRKAGGGGRKVGGRKGRERKSAAKVTEEDDEELEEEDGEGEGEGEGAGEEAPTPAETDGDGEGGEGGGGEVEGEGEEDEGGEEATRRGKRSRAGSFKKDARPQKRKPSEQPPILSESGAAEGSEPPVSTGARQAKKQRKGVRGGTAATEGDGGEDEPDKDARLALSRRRAAHTRILDALRALPYSNFFESRVTRGQAPAYSSAIRRPLCLKDIGKKIKSGEVGTTGEMMREVAVLCANAVQFNGDEGEGTVGWAAKQMWESFERLMSESLSTEFAAENP
ncbi:SPOSA6832_01731, partial [Sporobolomyces salmonicolor]